MSRLITLSFLLFLTPSSKIFSQIIFSETFSSDSLPSGWTNDSLDTAAIHLWQFENPFNRIITGANFDTSFAIFDSDQGTVNDRIDEHASLTTPLIDIDSASVSLFLEFDQQYRGIADTTGSTRVLQMSTDSGSTWINIDSSQADIGYPNPAAHSVYDISSALAFSSVMIRFTYYGSWDFWWAIDNVSIISRQPCNGLPGAGSAICGSPTVCPNESFFLSLINNDQSNDLLYQWQSSIDSVNWIDMQGDTSEGVTINQQYDNFYRCAVTCGTQTSYSDPVRIQMNLLDCYCIGPFTLACDELEKVEFNTLLNDHSGCNGNPNSYINYPDSVFTTDVTADSTYELNIESGDGSGNHCAAVWFDWNHDGNFQGADEFYHISDSIPESSSNIATSIQIPTTAIGLTRMRVRYIYNNPAVQTSDCASYGYGETEDYTINVLNFPLSVQELPGKNINVFPVPANDILKIETANQNKIVSYQLFDETGRLCLSLNSKSNTVEINVSGCKRGFYVLRIQYDEGVVVRKVVLD